MVFHPLGCSRKDPCTPDEEIPTVQGEGREMS